MTDEKMINLIYDKLLDNTMSEQFGVEYYDECMVDNAGKKIVIIYDGDEYELVLKNNGRVWQDYEPNLSDRARGIITKYEKGE